MVKSLLIVLMTLQSLWVCAKGVPDSPTITRTFLVPGRSVAIVWTIVSDADSYELSFNRAQGQRQNGECKTYLHADTHFVDGGTNSLLLTELEEFSTYFVSVTAIDSTGRSQPSVSVQFDTHPAAPSSPPSSVTVTANSSTAVVVTWNPVPCIDRNSVITEYILQLRNFYTARVMEARNFGEIQHFVYGLTPSHYYDIQVSAVNSKGNKGPASPFVSVRTLYPESVHIQFKSIPVPNHGFLLRGEIEEGRDGLFCVTNKSDCCHIGPNRAGEWYHPNGSVVLPYLFNNNMYRNRNTSIARLNQRRDGGVNGMYRCDIPDVNGIIVSLYVGLYTETTGEPEINSISFNVVSEFPIDNIYFATYDSNYNVGFELNCITSGGPVESVTWARNGGEIPIGSRVNKTLQDTLNAVYHNKLNVGDRFAGLYSCEIKSIRPTYTVRRSKNVTIVVANPPTNLTVDLEGLSSIHITWNAPEFDADVTDYRIYILENFHRDTRTIKVSASTTEYSVHYLRYTSSYNIYVVALSQHLPSHVVGPVETTIGIPDPVVSLMAFPDVTSINVTWNPPIEPHGTIEKYEVEHWRNDGSDQTHYFMDVEGIEAVLTSLLPDTSYVIMVRPYTFVGAGDPVTIRSTTLKMYIVEDIEVEVINATGVRVSWSPVVIPFWNLTHYTLYYHAYSSVLQKTLNHQSINVHVQGEIPPTSFVLQIPDIDPDDDIEYFFEITSNLEVQELVFESNLSNTTVFMFDVMPFQLQLSPVDYCATWKPDKSENVEKNIHIGIAKAISKLCNCTFIVGFIRSGVFRCWNSPTEVTYRSAIVGSSAQNASSIVHFIENWVESQPALRLHSEKLELKVENKCPVRLTSLSDPECPLVNPVGNDTVSLTSGNARVTQCVKKCI